MFSLDARSTVYILTSACCSLGTNLHPPKRSFGLSKDLNKKSKLTCQRCVDCVVSVLGSNVLLFVRFVDVHLSALFVSGHLAVVHAWYFKKMKLLASIEVCVEPPGGLALGFPCHLSVFGLDIFVMGLLEVSREKLIYFRNQHRLIFSNIKILSRSDAAYCE